MPERIDEQEEAHTTPGLPAPSDINASTRLETKVLYFATCRVTVKAAISARAHEANNSAPVAVRPCKMQNGTNTTDKTRQAVLINGTNR